MLHTTRAAAEQFVDVDAHSEEFVKLLGGHVYFQCLYTATKLGLFDLLEKHGPMNADNIATSLNIEPKPARIILLTITNAGLLEKSGKAYANTEMARTFLCSHSLYYVLDFLEFEHHIVYRGMKFFYESVLNNKNEGLKAFPGDELTLYQRLAHEPETKAIFQDAMHNISVMANKILVRNLDFSNIRYLVDVGGGDGTNLIEFARTYPQLHGAVFDIPTMIPITKKNIQGAGLHDRLQTMSGNCFEDDFPSQADCLLFAHFFTIWSEEQNIALLKKSYKALPSGGKVIIFNQMQNDDGTGPSSAAVGSPYFLAVATGSGMLYTWSEYKNWMKEAGFETVDLVKLPLHHGAIIGTKK